MAERLAILGVILALLTMGCATDIRRRETSRLAAGQCLATHKKWNNGLDESATERIYVLSWQRRFDVLFVQGEVGTFGPPTKEFWTLASCMLELENESDGGLRVISTDPWFPDAQIGKWNEFIDPVYANYDKKIIKIVLFIHRDGELEFIQEREFDEAWYGRRAPDDDSSLRSP